MPSVTYDFVPGQTVYVIDSGTIKSGNVTEVTIEITSNVPGEEVITYWVNIDGQSKGYTEDVYDSCSAASGYDQEVYLNALTGSDIAVDVSLAGETLEASVVIDGGTPIALSFTVVGGEMFQDVLDNLNQTMNPGSPLTITVAEATLVENNIRITSVTTGNMSIVDITDAGSGSPVGSPIPTYFSRLNNHTGSAAKVDGNGPGAIEALQKQIC